MAKQWPSPPPKQWPPENKDTSPTEAQKREDRNQIIMWVALVIAGNILLAVFFAAIGMA